jgi:methionyl-tRNA synthetase
MAKKEKFYVTTPIYYPSGKPHIGSAYTTIAGDVLARWNKLLGKDVFFLVGTDEHTKKVVKAAALEGKSPKDYTDSITPVFKGSWDRLSIGYDRFIRTSDSDHKTLVTNLLSNAFKNGDIYKGFYEGLYCFECEAYYTEKDSSDSNCPIHKKALEVLKEETYFFRLSKYQDKLLKLYKDNPDFVSPSYRKSEVVNRVSEGLKDLSISRKNEGWGIPLPFDNSHVCYVWYDALTNYLSGVGIESDKKLFRKFWPADVLLVGKDILWFHAVIFPAILFSSGIDVPKKVFAHGWWLFNDSKIGKSSGNALDLDLLIEKFGSDSLRYFLFRETPFGNDGNFSESLIIKRHNNELADKLGNLVSRVSALAQKYGLSKASLPVLGFKNLDKVSKLYANLELDKALAEIFAYVDDCNEFITQRKPWESGDKKVLYELVFAIRNISILLFPFMPHTCEKIAKHFGFDIALDNINKSYKIIPIIKSEILFSKIDLKDVSSLPNVNKSSEGVVFMSELKFDDWSKVDLRVGKVVSAVEVDSSDKLLRLEVDFAEGKYRTVMSGIRKFYSPKEIKGKKFVFLANLAPRKIMGVSSEAMVLAAHSKDDKGEEKLSLFVPDKDADIGSKLG